MNKALPFFLLSILNLSNPLQMMGLSETEPNGSFSTANVISEDSVITGSIGSSGDAEDYFAVMPDDEGTITFNLSYSNTGSGSDDLFIYVYSSSYSQISSSFLYDVGNSSGNNIITLHCRGTDTVFFRITSTGVFSYSFQVQRQSSGLPDAEPNNTLAEAQSINANDTVFGRVGYLSPGSDADDYFYTILPDDGSVRYYLWYDNTSGSSASDIFTYVYNKAGTQIGNRFLYDQQIGPGGDTNIIYCRAQDTLYFRIRSTGCFSYKLYYEVLPTAPADPEPNNSLAEASPFTAQDTARGRIGYTSVGTDDDDYYITALPTFGSLTIHLDYVNTSGNGSSDIFLYAYNEAGIQLASKFMYDQPYNLPLKDSIVIHCRDLDTVYFRVRSTGCFSYDLHYDVYTPTNNDPEPNGNLSTAVAFNQGDTVQGRIGYQSVSTDDDDYYYTILPDDGSVRYYLWYDNTSGSSASDMFIYVYNEAGTQIGNRFLYDRQLGPGADTNIVYCRAQDTLFFRVRSTGCFSYKLYYEVIPSGSSDPEPNNALAEASLINAQDTAFGRVGYTSVGTDNDDYYYTVLPDDGSVRYYLWYDNTSGSFASDMFTYVYNKAGTQIGNRFLYDQQPGPGADTNIVHCRAQDTLFFRVRSTGCFSYKLYYEVLPSGSADPEPNNTLTEASVINPQDTAFGRVGYTSVGTDNDDFYYTVLPDDGSVRYYLWYDNTSGSLASDIFTYVYNEAGTQIGSRFLYDQPVGAGADTNIVYCRAQDTLYFRVRSTGCFSYKLYYEVIPSGFADSEPNNSLSEATPIGLDSLLQGRVGYSSSSTDQDDYFAFSTQSASSIDLLLNANNTSGSAASDFFIYLYNSQGSQIALIPYYDRALGQFTDTLSFSCLPADTFYLRVRSTGCFSYQMEFNVQDEQPVANIEHSQFGNSFAFMANIREADSIHWDFDDSSTSALRYPKKEFGIGVFDVSLEAINSRCNIVDRDTLQVTVTGIEYYTPHKAGTSALVGFFTIRVFGGGFDSNATASLSNGSLTLNPQELKTPSGAEMNLLFSFTGAEFGTYDLQINLSNGETFLFPDGFEITKEEPGIDLETSVVGPVRIRTNLWVDYTLNITNNKSQLANGVMACLVLPRNVETNIKDILFKRSGKISLKGSVWNKLTIDRESFSDTYFQGDFDPANDVMTVDLDELYSDMNLVSYVDIDTLYGSPFKGRLYPIYVPLIPGNTTTKIHFKIRSPENQTMNIVSYPWVFTFRQNPMSPEALDYIHEGGMQAAALAEHSPHPALRAVGKSAGWIDIGSQILFTEYYDWKYGGNNANAEFYANQGISGIAEIAGGKTGYGDKYDRSLRKIDESKLGLKRNTEYRDHIRKSIDNQRKVPNVYKEQLLDDLANTRDHLATLDKRLSFAEKQRIINARKDYWAKRGINLTDKALKELLFGDDEDDPKSNEPKDFDRNRITSVTSMDPNEIYGTSGPTSENYIRKNDRLSYQVSFENVDTAKAPAQIVRVELDLDNSLVDMSSIELGDVVIAGKTYFAEEQRQSYFQDIDLRPAKNMIVRVNSDIDSLTGKMIWQFTSLNPNNQELITDPDDGFLPPNINAPEGEGSIHFNLKLRESLNHQDSHELFADIYFDQNEPIRTNVWLNTIDEEAPQSFLVKAEVQNDTVILLEYNGTDEESGVSGYYLHVRVNNGKWIGKEGFSMPSNGKAEILGSIGNTYDFYIEAIDSVGNKELKPEEPEISVSLLPQESSIDPDFKLYPNPSTDQVFVKSNGNFLDADVVISDAYGRVVFSEKRSFYKVVDQEINLRGMAGGAYIFYFETRGGKSTTQKLILLNP